jgi:hypothetical protein
MGWNWLQRVYSWIHPASIDSYEIYLNAEVGKRFLVKWNEKLLRIKAAAYSDSELIDCIHLEINL